MVQDESLRWLYEDCHDRYEYKDGKLFFKRTLHSRQVKGAEVGSLNNMGYLKVCLDRKNYLIHRLVFLMHHGYLPELLDHIDRNKLNNRIENLREANKELNSWNRDRQANNTSGHRGVSWNKNAGKWHAYIKIKGKRIHLGLFNTVDEARQVYEKARLDV
jgi:hypothetical protein